MDRLQELQSSMQQLPSHAAKIKAQLCSAEARVAECHVTEAESALAAAAVTQSQAVDRMETCAVELALAQSGQNEHDEEALQVGSFTLASGRSISSG
jgi:hypothetical protein